ncbi:hypothetical protein VR45_26550 [Streptomyces sp. NRRL S-495]|nr:hypothetical protein VR45_26550 [Streptomyces sp. NRRL S-495]
MRRRTAPRTCGGGSGPVGRRGGGQVRRARKRSWRWVTSMRPPWASRTAAVSARAWARRSAGRAT